ncbi:hypothetical protein JCM8097_001222 [Rhodosporidiobolus ruineniae]
MPGHVAMATTPPTTPSGPPAEALVVPISAFVFGFTSGLVSSSKLASKQFLAENAHRLPTTVQGWYFYQKTKNYRVLYGGIKGGLATGARLGLWTAAFVTLQDALDRGARRVVEVQLGDDKALEGYRTKAVAGGLAGVGLAGAAGYIYRLSRYTARRRLLLGFTLGAVAGGAVDLRDWLRTRLPAKE